MAVFQENLRGAYGGSEGAIGNEGHARLGEACTAGRGRARVGREARTADGRMCTAMEGGAHG
jgi:hypothetical protein